MRLHVTDNSVNSDLANLVSYFLHKRESSSGLVQQFFIVTSVVISSVLSFFPLPKFQAERGEGAGGKDVCPVRLPNPAASLSCLRAGLVIQQLGTLLSFPYQAQGENLYQGSNSQAFPHGYGQNLSCINREKESDMCIQNRTENK